MVTPPHICIIYTFIVTGINFSYVNPLSFFTNTYPFIFKPVSPVHPAISHLPFYQFLTFHFRHSQYHRFLKNTFPYFIPLFCTHLPLSIFILLPCIPHLYLLHTRHSTTFIEATQTILHRKYRPQTTLLHKAQTHPLTDTYKVPHHAQHLLHLLSNTTHYLLLRTKPQPYTQRFTTKPMPYVTQSFSSYFVYCTFQSRDNLSELPQVTGVNVPYISYILYFALSTFLRFNTVNTTYKSPYIPISYILYFLLSSKPKIFHVTYVGF